MKTVLKKKELEELKQAAKNIRKDILVMTHAAQSGHPGGSLSAADILTYLYFKQMKLKPSNPEWKKRDYFFLSKGHCTPIIYSALARKGYFPLEELFTFRKINSRLQGHVSHTVPGVEAYIGSLGQGLSVALGAALGLKMDKEPNKVYAMLGDGEIQEGQIWEAVMAAAHHEAGNLCAIVDFNNGQIDGHVKEVMNPAPIAEKFRAFGWEAMDINGHDYKQIEEAFSKFSKKKSRKPFAIIAHTIKGKGVSFMEDKPEWHGNPPNDEQLEKALEELK